MEGEGGKGREGEREEREGKERERKEKGGKGEEKKWGWGGVYQGNGTILLFVPATLITFFIFVLHFSLPPPFLSGLVV